MSEPLNDAFVTFMKEVTSPDDQDLTIEKLVGIYRVVVPHLLAVYTFHQRVTSDIVDAPTVRSLKFMLDDDHEQLVQGEMMIQDIARTPELRERAGGSRDVARVERDLPYGLFVVHPHRSVERARSRGR